MAELIEKDGRKVIVTEKEIELGDLEESIKVIQIQINSIDYNLNGLQQRRAKLVEKLDQLNTIKKEAGLIDPASEKS